MKHVLLFFSAAVNALLIGQNLQQKSFVQSKDLFATRYFIENKGQFDNILPDSQKVLYALEEPGGMIFFTKEGPVYQLEKQSPLSERELERKERGKNVRPKKNRIFYVHVTWKNKEKNSFIETKDKTLHHYSYGPEKYKSQGYKTIVYKNVYKNIDIEYVVPEDKITGIKYNIILHPGANAKNIKISYSGDVKSIKKETDGNLVIKTPLLDITEHFPMSFYKNEMERTVSSDFRLDSNYICFELPNGYDQNKTLVIDPFVTTITALTANNAAYDIDYDYAGNVYVYGGGNFNPFHPKVAKYNNMGLLLWVFNGSLTAPAWVSSGTIIYTVGNFCINKSNGKTYLGQGMGATVIRLNSSGIYDNFITPTLPTWQEIWDLGYNCSTDEIYAFGGGVTSNLSASKINQISASVSPVNFTGLGNLAQDITNYTIDNTNNIFIHYSGGGPFIENHIARVNAAFSSTVWLAPTTFISMSEPSNKDNYLGFGFSVASVGFNCLSANSNYLFYYDGLNLAAYSKINGALQGSIAIAGNTLRTKGGISADECNNIYVGANGSILSYNFNGTAFISLPSIPLNTANNNQDVYDLKLDESSNLLYACGNGFAGTYTAINSLTCFPISVSISTICSGINSSATASITSSQNQQFTFIWTNSTGTISSTINSSLNTNTINNVPNGTYTLYTFVNYPCGSPQTSTFNINCITCSVIAGATTTCNGSQHYFSLSSSGLGYTNTPAYVWTGPAGFTSSEANPIFVNGAFGIYTVTISDGLCSNSATVNVNPASLFTVNILTTPASCNGSNGSASVSVIGGTAPFTYSWSTNPPQTSTIVSNLSPGIYSCSVTDNKNCTYSSSANVTLAPPLLISLNVQPSNGCTGKTVTVTAQANGGFPPVTYNWVGGPSSATYIVTSSIPANLALTLTATDAANCILSQTTNVLFNASPTLQVSSANVCPGTPVSLTASGAISYTWSPISDFSNPYISEPVCITNSSATYSITGSNGSCTSYTTTNVTVFPNASANAGPDFTFGPGDNMVLNGTGTGTLTWIYGQRINCKECPNTTIEPEHEGCYVLEAVNEFGCKTQDTVFISFSDEELVYIPDVFTPNNDNANDIFKIRAWRIKKSEMIIYNRWGNLVFETNNALAGWNGLNKQNIPCPDGTYFYIIKVVLDNNKTQVFKGNVSLFR